MSTTKQPKRELSDEENAAVQTELKRLRELKGTWRAVGIDLGFPLGTAQQTISRAAQHRAGREVADALYRFLGTTREQFLRSKGVAVTASRPEPTTMSDRVIEVLTRVGRELGFTSEEVELASSMVRGLHGTTEMSEEVAHELLERARSNRRDVRRMFPTAVVDGGGGSAIDELGGGRSTTPAGRRKR